MPDLSKFKPDGAQGTEYDFKDEVARQSLENKADTSEVTEVDTPNSIPFLYRKTPHNADGVFLDKLVGGSVAWNQLVSGMTTTTHDGITTEYDATTHKIKITNNSRTTNYSSGSIRSNVLSETIINHKYLWFISPNVTGIAFVYAGTPTSLNGIFNGNGQSIQLRVLNTYDFVTVHPIGDVTTFYVNIIDLTQMFGTIIADYIYSLEQATAGSGIAWLKSYGFFTKDYYPYNTGELVSVKTSGKKYVEKNLIDPTTLDLYDVTGAGIMRVGYAPIKLAAGTYTVSWASANTPVLLTNITDGYSYSTLTNGGNFTLNSTSEIMIRTGATSVNNVSISNIQLEKGSTATTYEPYTEHTYDISNIDLRGIPKLVNNELVYDGDTYDSNGNVTRKYGIVDLGSLSWKYTPWEGVNYIVSSNISGNCKKPENDNVLGKIIMARYVNVMRNDMTTTSDKVICLDHSGNIDVIDSEFSDAATFKTAMSGVYLIYELATPTTETTDPYTNPQICDKDGTEEFIDIRTVPVPVGHNSRYADLPAIMDGDYLGYMARNFASEEYVDTELDTKVDKVSGKGLSTNDYTNEEKALVATIPNKADSVDVEGTQTVSGNPLTLTDAAPINAESLVVELEPKQDLHGQSAPYVGGSGKNKLPMTVDGIKAANTDGTWFGNAYTVSGVTFTVLTDNDGNVVGIQSNNGGSASIALPFTLKAGTYIMSSGFTEITGTTDTLLFNSNNTVIAMGNDYTPGQQFTLSSDSSVRWVFRVATASILCKPMLRLSTETDPTFAPYSNICPITGYTECEVESVGKNLLAPTEYNGEYNKAVGGDLKQGTAQQYSIDDNGTLSIVNTVEWHGRLFATGVLRQGNYRLPTQKFGDANIRASILVTDENLIVKRNIANRTSYGQHNSITITVQDGERIAYVANASVAETFTITNFYLYAEDEFVEQYEPYHSSNATIQFGQTVYGGEVDFLKGETDDEWEVVEYDGSNDENWSMLGSSSASAYAMTIALPVNVITTPVHNVPPILTNYLQTIANTETWVNYDGFIALQSEQGLSIVTGIKSITTVEAWRTFLASNPLQVVYKKATPTTISTPPTELKLLKGTNNLTTNGTTINLGYQPDNVIGEVKGEIEAKADNTTKTQPNYYHQYDSTTHKFSDVTKSFNPYDVENVLEIIENTRQVLETAINDHANLFSRWIYLAEVDSSGVSVTIPSSAVRILVELYVIDFSSGSETHVICASLDAEANNPVRDEYIELHGTALNADHYVTGKAIGTDTWITTANTMARVYYHK